VRGRNDPKDHFVEDLNASGRVLKAEEVRDDKGGGEGRGRTLRLRLA
jgi:hypothetical protein